MQLLDTKNRHSLKQLLDKLKLCKIILQKISTVKNSPLLLWFTRGALFVIIFLILLPVGFVQDIVNVGHFYSSFHMFENAFDHHLQFGVDIVDNVGPFGFLHYPYTYTGGAYWTKICWYGLLCALYAYYAIKLSRNVSSLINKTLFLFTIVFFPLIIQFPWFSFEIIPRLVIVFSGLFLLNKSNDRKRLHELSHIFLIGIFYSFLTLEKASNVYFLIFLITLLSANWALQHRWHNVLSLWGSYFFGLLSFWLVAGQKLINLFSYFNSMRFFIDSYQHVFAVGLEQSFLQTALISCLLIFVLLLVRMATSYYHIRSFAVTFPALLIAVAVFLSWKQGCIRNINSYGTVLYILPCMLALITFYPIGANKETCVSVLNFHSKRLFHFFRVSLFLVFLFFYWSHIQKYENRLNVHRTIASEFINRIVTLIQYRPIQKHQALDAKINELKTANLFPIELKNAMLNKTVDELGSTPELILLNELNYAPRPVPIEHVVANRELNQKNNSHFQQAQSAPDFILLPDFKLYVSDSLSYLHLLINYHVRDTFQNWLILEKNPDWKSIYLKRTLKTKVPINEWVFLNNKDSFLWVEIELKRTLYEKLKSFFYIPEHVRMDILMKDGEIIQKDLSLRHLSSGFLINPILKGKKNTKCGEFFFFGLPWYDVKALRIAHRTPDKQKSFKPIFYLSFSNVMIPSLRSNEQFLTIAEAEKKIALFSELLLTSLPKRMSLELLLGQWACNGQPAQITIENDQLCLLNEKGARSFGTLSNDQRYVIATDWNDLKGVLVDSDKTLKWENGTTWHR